MVHLLLHRVDKCWGGGSSSDEEMAGGLQNSQQGYSTIRTLLGLLIPFTSFTFYFYVRLLRILLLMLYPTDMSINAATCYH